MKTLFEHIFHIRPQAQRKVLLMFAYAFASAAAYVVSRSAAASLFLSRIGPERLPALYVISAAVVATISMGYTRLAGRNQLARVIWLTLLGLAVLSVALRGLLGHYGEGLAIVGGIYLLAEIRGSLGTIQFGTLINETFADDDPRGTFAFIGAGATLAGVIFGAVVGLAAHRLGTANLLYLAAGLDLLTVIPLSLLAPGLPVQGPPVPRSEPHGRDRAERDQPVAPLSEVVRSGYLRSIAGLISLEVIVVTMIEFQWKVAARNTVATEDGLTSFFGLYYAAVYLLTGSIQLFVTGRFLRRYGMLAGLMAFPGALLIATTGILATSAGRVGLWAATAAKGCESLRRSIHDPVVQMLYWPMPHGPRRKAIAFVRGIVKPVAEAAAGLLLLKLFLFVPDRQISHLVFVLIVGWMCLAVRCRRHYEGTLRDSRRAPRERPSLNVSASMSSMPR